jgi:tRNA-splicing endonuclease subunit Sen15, fungi type
MSTSTTTKALRTTASSSIPAPSALTTLLSTQSTYIHPPSTTALPLEILHNLRYQHSWTDVRLHHSTTTSTSVLSLIPASAPSHPDPISKDTLKPSISDLDLTTPFPKTPNARQPLHQPPPAPSPHEPLKPPTTLLSGLPPKPLYIHPDLQRKLLKAGIPESTLQPEREWVLPTSLGAKWTLSQICGAFDSLPLREPRRISKDGKDTTEGPTGGRHDNAEVRKSDGIGTEEEEAVVQHQDAKRVLLAMKAHEGMGGDGTVVYYIVQEGEVKPRQN